MVFIFLGLIIGIVSSIAFVSACDCVKGSFEENVGVADQIFSGKVIALVNPLQEKCMSFPKCREDQHVDPNTCQCASGPQIITSSDLMGVRFEVSQTWKGEQTNELTVYTESSGASCGYEFEQGKEYLVFASKGEGKLRTGLCSETQLLSEAQEDINSLRTEQKIPQLKIMSDTSGLRNDFYSLEILRDDQIGPEMNITNDIFNINLRYGGGCGKHSFTLVWDGRLIKSIPPQAHLRLFHDGSRDSCEALLFGSLKFDLSPLKEKYDKDIIIHFIDYKGETHTLTYSPTSKGGIVIEQNNSGKEPPTNLGHDVIEQPNVFERIWLWVQNLFS